MAGRFAGTGDGSGEGLFRRHRRDNSKVIEGRLEGLCRLAFTKSINTLPLFADVDGQLHEIRIA